MGWRTAVVAAGALGCTEYEVGSKPEVGTFQDTGSPPVTSPTTPPPELPSCASFVAPAVDWVASAPFSGPDDLADDGGRPFYDPLADRSGFTGVAVPDVAGIPVGQDRAYVGTFELAEIPVDLSLELESDDGIWVWVNGTEIGHWGGDYQQEGCVNEHANCLVTTVVPAVSVTPFLAVGANTVAARVSNPVLDAYFDILMHCVEP